MTLHLNLIKTIDRAIANTDPATAMLATVMAQATAHARSRHLDAPDDEAVTFAVQAHLDKLDDAIEKAAEHPEAQARWRQIRDVVSTLIPAKFNPSEAEAAMRGKAAELAIPWPPTGRDVGRVFRACKQLYGDRIDQEIVDGVLAG